MEGKHLLQESLRKRSNGRDVRRTPEKRVNPMRKIGTQRFSPQTEMAVLRPWMGIEKRGLENSQLLQDMHFMIIGCARIFSEDLHC